MFGTVLYQKKIIASNIFSAVFKILSEFPNNRIFGHSDEMTNIIPAVFLKEITTISAAFVCFISCKMFCPINKIDYLQLSRL